MKYEGSAAAYEGHRMNNESNNREDTQGPYEAYAHGTSNRTKTGTKPNSLEYNI